MLGASLVPASDTVKAFNLVWCADLFAKSYGLSSQVFKSELSPLSVSEFSRELRPLHGKEPRRFFFFKLFNPFGPNFTKWSNTLKQFVGNLPTNCVSVFDCFVGFWLKGLRYSSLFLYVSVIDSFMQFWMLIKCLICGNSLSRLLNWNLTLKTLEWCRESLVNSQIV